jgi:hypothetical protein
MNMSALHAPTKPGVVVSPKVWSQMQCMLSMLTHSNAMPGSPSTTSTGHSALPPASNTPINSDSLPDLDLPNQETPSDHVDISPQNAQLAPPQNKSTSHLEIK